MKLKVTPPGDIYPVLYESQKAEIREMLIRYFKSANDATRFLPQNKLIFLNKVSNVDAADEIIVDGQIIGQRIFDPLRRMWCFKPLLHGVARIIEKEIGYYAIVDLPRIVRRFVVHRSHIVKGELPEVKGEFIALQTKSGAFQGVGEVIRGGRIKVLKSWRSKKYIEFSSHPTFKEVISANVNRLNVLEEDAIRFLRTLRKRYDKPFFVSFSGGKDSLVTLHLALKALGQVPILFNDTGLELPGTREYVEDLSRELNVKLIVADAGNAFRSALEVFGPPARDYRWCCKVIKLAPISRVINNLFPEGAISIVGVRRYESGARARSPRVWVNRWLPKLLSASPIIDWTALDVWMYIIANKLKVNPMYSMGFSRLGCWLCPACNIADFVKVKDKFPTMWNWWETKLTEWCSSKNLGNVFRSLDLWRWKRLPGNISIFLKRHGLGIDMNRIYRGVSVDFFIKEIEYKDDTVFVKGFLKSNERLPMILKTLGEVSNLRELSVVAQDFVLTISKKGIFVLKAQNNSLRKSLKLLLGAYFRSTLCVGCELCSQVCSNIEVSKEGVVIGDNCSHCSLCSNLCPLVEYVATDYVDYTLSKFRAR